MFINCYEAFCARLKASPKQIAIVDKKSGERCTYRELSIKVDTLSVVLSSFGVKPQMKIVLFVPMSLELYVILIALFKMGVSVVLIDPSQGAKFVNRALARIAPEGFIGVPKAHLFYLLCPHLRAVPLKFSTKSLPFVKHIFASLQEQSLDMDNRCDASCDALITFTSGSTGEPKAIVRSHQFLLDQYRVLKPHIGLESNQVDLSGLPIFVLANLFAGVTSVIANTSLAHPRKIDSAALVRAIEEEQIERIGASPMLYERLLLADAKSLQTLKNLYMGGAPVMPRLLGRLKEAMPLCQFHILYGSSEAEPISSYESSELSQSIQTKMQKGAGLFVGSVVPEIALAIWNQEDEVLQQGRIGEIVVSGHHVVHSYLKPQENSGIKVQRAGKVWHKTGDSGYLDESGKLWLVGRTSAIIRDEKGVLYPFSVEVAANALVESKVAIVGKKSKRKLFIEGIKDPQMEAYLAKELSWAKIDHFESIPVMPLDKRHNAKIDYSLLSRL
jgi:olefin beta-lactone synthetase